MGKWILYGLILLNLFAFLWFSSLSEEDTIQPKQQPKALFNSEKISIVKPSSSTEKETQLDSQTSEAPEQTSEHLALEQPLDVAQNEITKDPLQAIIDQQANENEAVETTDPNQIVSSKQAVIPTTQKLTASPQALPQTINQTVTNATTTNNSELTVDVKTAEEQRLLDEMASFASTDDISAPQTTTLPMLCYQYGPLNQTQAEAITTVMQQQQIPMVQQNRTLVEQRGFLVLIMPQKNSNAAKSQMRAARKAGLDAFAITKGEWVNGVSLGIFTAKENADKLFNQAKALIPKSQLSIKKRIRESEVYRILFKLKNEQDPAVLLANNPFPSFNSSNPLQKTTKIAKKSCETVEF